MLALNSGRRRASRQSVTHATPGKPLSRASCSSRTSAAMVLRISSRPRVKTQKRSNGTWRTWPLRSASRGTGAPAVRPLHAPGSLVSPGRTMFTSSPWVKASRTNQSTPREPCSSQKIAARGTFVLFSGIPVTAPSERSTLSRYKCAISHSCCRRGSLSPRSQRDRVVQCTSRASAISYCLKPIRVRISRIHVLNTTGTAPIDFSLRRV